MTEFQELVYGVVREVPEGRVTTYKVVAGLVGCGSPRAVGQALRVNPYAPEVPCHRVISSNLRIGGFRGAVVGSDIAEKLAILAAEGVKFGKDGLLSDRGCIWP